MHESISELDIVAPEKAHHSTPLSANRQFPFIHSCLCTQLAAAKHAMSLGMAHADGQYNVAMVKASNLDIVPPKEKHVRYLISWTNDYPAEDNLIAVFKSLCERLEEKVPDSGYRAAICGLRAFEGSKLRMVH